MEVVRDRSCAMELAQWNLSVETRTPRQSRLRGFLQSLLNDDLLGPSLQDDWWKRAARSLGFGTAQVNSHRIRLPAPWQARWLSDQSPSRVLFRRSFQLPSGLDEHSRLAVELALLEPLPVSLVLNGQPCSLKNVPAKDGQNLVFEAALDPRQLQPVNHIEVEIQTGTASRASSTEATDAPPSSLAARQATRPPMPPPASSPSQPQPVAADLRIGHHYLNWVGLRIE